MASVAVTNTLMTEVASPIAVERYDSGVLDLIQKSNVYASFYRGRQAEDVYMDLATLVEAENSNGVVPLDPDLIEPLYRLAIEIQPTNTDPGLRFDKRGAEYEFGMICRAVPELNGIFYGQSLQAVSRELKILYGIEFDPADLSSFYNRGEADETFLRDLEIMDSLVEYYDLENVPVNEALVDESALMRRIESEGRDYRTERKAIQRVVENKNNNIPYESDIEILSPVKALRTALEVQPYLEEWSPLKISGAKGNLGEALIVASAAGEKMFDGATLQSGVVNAFYGIEFTQSDLDAAVMNDFLELTPEDLDSWIKLAEAA